MNIDWQAVQRLDNAMLIQFLTSSASVLHKNGIITPKEIDSLRATLSRVSTASQTTPGTASLLSDLDQNGNEIFSILRFRFGVTGLALNLVRLSLRQALIPLASTLVASGEALIKKSELVFNRSIQIYSAGKPRTRTLHSSFVIDMAEQMAVAASSLRNIGNHLARMIPSQEPSTNDAAVDLELAEALDFNGVTDSILPAIEERALIRRIYQTVLDFAEYCGAFAEQVIQNSGLETGYNLLASAEILKAECLRLAAISFPEGESIAMWETRRRHLAANISSIGDALKLVCNAAEDAVNFEKVQASSVSERESLKSKLIMTMVGSGTQVSQAARAATDFISYLKDKNLRPHEVIAGELSRINPQLSIRCLEILQEDGDQKGTTVSNTDLKEKAFNRGRTIADQLKALAITTAFLAIVCPFVASCGLKTAPVSEAPELRPDVPFKNQKDTRPSYIIAPQGGTEPNNSSNEKK